jgi:two-component system, NarL family, response regulator
MNGLEAIRIIREASPEARIIVLTMYQGDEDIFRALQAGAITYVLKDTVTEDLVRTVRQVHAGERPIPSSVAKQLAQRASHPGLSNREVEVVRLIAKGMRNKEIALALSLSEETIKVHIKRILAKLNATDRTAAVSIALERGIIHIGK